MKKRKKRVIIKMFQIYTCDNKRNKHAVISINNEKNNKQ